MRVVVIGGTGNVGLALVAALAADPAVDSIVGVARRVPDASALPLPFEPGSKSVTWHAADVSVDPLDVVAGADVVVHLAWKIQPQHHEAVMMATNVVGTRRVVDAILRHGVPSLVYASSVGAYGPGPKDTFVDESWPAVGIPSSSYSRHKAMVEAMLDDVEALHPELRVVRMRTSLVFQRMAAASVTRLFLSRFAPRSVPSALKLIPRTPRFVFQATHSADIAEAYRLAVHSTARGAFNIAADPVLDPRVIASALGARTIPLPAFALRAGAAATFALHLQNSEKGWVDMAVETPLMSSARARAELGWMPTRTSIEALQDLFTGIGEGAGGPTPHLAPRRGGPVVMPPGRGAPALPFPD